MVTRRQGPTQHTTCTTDQIKGKQGNKSFSRIFVNLAIQNRTKDICKSRGINTENKWSVRNQKKVSAMTHLKEGCCVAVRKPEHQLCIEAKEKPGKFLGTKKEHTASRGQVLPPRLARCGFLCWKEGYTLDDVHCVH